MYQTPLTLRILQALYRMLKALCFLQLKKRGVFSNCRWRPPTFQICLKYLYVHDVQLSQFYFPLDAFYRHLFFTSQHRLHEPQVVSEIYTMFTPYENPTGSWNLLQGKELYLKVHCQILAFRTLIIHPQQFQHHIYFKASTYLLCLPLSDLEHTSQSSDRLRTSALWISPHAAS